MNYQIVLPLAFLAVGKSSAFIAPVSHVSSCTTFYRASIADRNNPSGELRRLYMSNVGGNDNNNDGNNGDSDESNFLGDFLDPKKASEESDNLKRARAAMAEESLPINFDDDEGSTDSTDDIEQDDADIGMEDQSSQEEIIDTPGGKINLLNNPNAADLANSPYLNVVAKLSPSDLISKFTSTAHPRVQDAVRSTILGLIGTLPKMAFETTTITTGEKLASLMFQLQMTGYMFKNAEYRLSLSQSLGMTENGTPNPSYLLDGDASDSLAGVDDEDEDDGPLSSGKIRGKIKVRYGKKKNDDDDEISVDSDDVASDKMEDIGNDESESSPAMEVEVDAAAYMAELRNEVAKLREDLTATRKSKEEAIRKDLLLYIRTLPQQELNTLTNTMSDDVLGAMKGLVNVVMGGIGEGQIDKNTVTEQSGEAMAQLCMWQLVVGYNLRELEVREEMKNALMKRTQDASESADDEDGEGSINYDEGGFE